MKKRMTKNISLALAFTFAVSPGLSGCGGSGGGGGTGKDVSLESVLNLDVVKNIDKLNNDMKEGNMPKSCDVLYDEMGSHPNVTVTDPDTIRTIYEELGEIKVDPKGPVVCVTDSYHHVVFKLQDETIVAFNFDGVQTLTTGSEEYCVTGGGALWNHVRDLQGMEEEKTE